jgi:hypothetical protein
MVQQIALATTVSLLSRSTQGTIPNRLPHKDLIVTAFHHILSNPRLSCTGSHDTVNLET